MNLLEHFVQVRIVLESANLGEQAGSAGCGRAQPLLHGDFQKPPFIEGQHVGAR
jgi:hypothetical protein